MKAVTLDALDTYDPETGDLQVIIETPRGSRNKFAYDPRQALFKLNKSLPAGAVFPYDFGFFPSALGQDGDPLDVLVIMDEPTYPGTLVMARLIGVIEADQTEEGKTERNDRLVAVATERQDYQNVKELTDLNTSQVIQIEHFFISYNQVVGKKFKPLGHPNAKQAHKLLEEGQKRFEKQQSQKS